MKNQSIICFANDWHNDPTSKHQVMRILSKENKILWLNSIGLRNPAFTVSDMTRVINKVKGLFKGIERINQNLYVMTPIVIPFHEYSFVRKFNKMILLLQIKYHIRKLSMKDFQVWTFIPTMSDIVEKMACKKLIYYCVDDWSKFSFVNKETVAQMEMDLIKRADVVITSARELYEQKKKLNPNTHLVLHGVDYEHFSKALDETCAIPADIAEIPKPIIGFFGLIHEWIDLSLIESVAKKHPEWSIVMIGKVSVDITDLRKIPNIYFLGQKDYMDLPGYCKAFDVAIIPFVINELTKSVNPIKLREYLAAGLPVVSVDLPEVRQYSKFVMVSRSKEEFIENLEKSIDMQDLQTKKTCSQEMAKENWHSKVLEIEKLIS